MHSEKTGSTKKLNCPARIQMYEVVLFKDYQSSGDCMETVKKNQEIHQRLNNGEQLTTETRIYVRFPTFAAHRNHNPFVSVKSKIANNLYRH